MKRNKIIRFAAPFAAALAAIALYAKAIEPPDAAKTMAAAARDFSAALGDGQREKALFAFDSDERLNWHFIPKARKGIPLGDLSPAQAALAHALISTSLGARGQLKAYEIMSLEDILRESETREGNKMAAMRKAEAYFISIFGEPGSEAGWGWRLEGHHLSFNFTVVGGKVAATTPLFMGANPHEVREGPRKGLKPLGAEEDLGRELLASLDEGQRAKAVIGAAAPEDIFTKADRKAALEGPPQGLAREAMNEAQRAKLGALIEEYARAIAWPLAEARLARIAAYTPEQAAQIRFAWMGSAEKGQAHYYRVQGPTFLIEYDNIQNNANHSHTVWRDFAGDFGLDVLAEHHKAAHGAGN